MTLWAQSVCPSDTPLLKTTILPHSINLPTTISSFRKNLPPIIAYKQDQANLIQVNNTWGGREEH